MSTTEYVQGGADFPTGGAKRTKKLLKEAIKVRPQSVFLFDTTAVRASKFSDTADKLPDGITFNVVGPDPYTNRSWYATIKRNAKGELTVT